MIKVLLSGLALFMLTSASGIKAQNMAEVKPLGNITAVKNGEVKIPVVIKNINAADVKTLTLTVSVAGEKKQMTVSPEMISTADGSAMFYVSAEAPSTTGLSDVTVTLDAVNGVNTDAAGNTARGSIMAVSRKVQHKVVIEDYTAFWCPTCPIGFVGIERSKINYGDNILVIAAHFQDPLSCLDYDDVTRLHMTLPRATVDRDTLIGDVNPYLGSERGDNGAKYGLGFDIEEQMAIDPVVELKVNGGIDGKKISVQSEITTLYTGEADLSVVSLVKQDSLSNPNWMQQNSLPYYYRDNPIIEKEPLFEQWFNGEVQVSNVKYCDVVRMASNALKGKKGVIPEQVEEEKTYYDEEIFNLDDYVKVKDTEYMHLCVFVIDNKTGKIVNSASIPLSEATAVECVEAGGDKNVEVARYTADGQRIAVPERGINIVKYADGTTRKVIVR